LVLQSKMGFSVVDDDGWLLSCRTQVSMMTHAQCAQFLYSWGTPVQNVFRLSSYIHGVNQFKICFSLFFIFMGHTSPNCVLA
jgi:hypothetical protein